MRDAFQKAGFRGTEPQRASGPVQRQGGGGQRQQGQWSGKPGGGNADGPCAKVFAAGYPKFFTDEGHTRPDLVQKEAEDLAECFKDARLTRHQLRAFYGHAQNQQKRLKYGTPFGAVQVEIGKLKAVAADRAGRRNNALPEAFKKFIDLNVNAVRTEKDYLQGFMPHFEAVVAYCAILRESERGEYGKKVDGCLEDDI
jgi:CRISPR type III-A-associated protein Csm2